MVDMGRASALLFQSEEAGERVSTVCYSTDEGELVIDQVSEGDLTQWCFEESPHSVKTRVGATEAQGLLDYFHLDEVDQLPAMLRLEYVGYNCAREIRDLFKRLGVKYHVEENPIER